MRLVLSRFPDSVSPALGACAADHVEGSPAPLGQRSDTVGEREAPAIHSTAGVDVKLPLQLAGLNASYAGGSGTMGSAESARLSRSFRFAFPAECCKRG